MGCTEDQLSKFIFSPWTAKYLRLSLSLSFSFRVYYCNVEHQTQHWKKGGHREACSGNCTRCLKPRSANRGKCLVDHPLHLRKEDKRAMVSGMPSAPMRLKAVCLACQSMLTMYSAEDCEVISEGPQHCFKGKHTLEPLPDLDKRRVWKNEVTISTKGDLQVICESEKHPDFIEVNNL